MTFKHLKLAAILVALTAGLSAATLARAAIDPSMVSLVPMDKLDFKGKPGGPQQASVFGDPDKPGLYGIVIKWPPHTGSRPHTHPYDRYVWVLSGTWWVNSGTNYSPDTMVPVKPGTFVTDLANQYHYDGAKDEPAVIYIVGMGPTAGKREPK